MCRAISQSSGADEPCRDSAWPIHGSPARSSWISFLSDQSRTVILCDASSSSEGKRNKIWGKQASRSTLDWNLYVATLWETSYTCDIWGSHSSGREDAVVWCVTACRDRLKEMCKEGEESKETFSLNHSHQFTASPSPRPHFSIPLTMCPVLLSQVETAGSSKMMVHLITSQRIVIFVVTTMRTSVSITAVFTGARHWSLSSANWFFF
jgi:hypothetical protein